MPFLIDGHNLIGQTPGLSLADPDDEQKLVELLRKYLTRSGKKGAVIFDRGVPGGGGQWSNARLEVQFARSPLSADDVIRQRLQREKNPRGLIVVSADRAVLAEARQAGAGVMAPRAFARQMLGGDSGKNINASIKERELSTEELAAWEEEFKNSR